MTCPALHRKADALSGLAHKDSASSRHNYDGTKLLVGRGPEMKMWLSSPANTARSAMTKCEISEAAPPQPVATMARQSLGARCWHRSDNNHQTMDIRPDRLSRSASAQHRMENAPNEQRPGAVASSHRYGYDQTRKPSVPPARTAPTVQMVESLSETTSLTERARSASHNNCLAQLRRFFGVPVHFSSRCSDDCLYPMRYVPGVGRLGVGDNVSHGGSQNER